VAPFGTSVPVAAVLTAVRAGPAFRGRHMGPANPARQPDSAGSGPHTCLLCLCDENDPSAMTAHRPDLVASTGCDWLMVAAEMAGLLHDSLRSSPHPARTGWECPPQIATRALGTEARSVAAARDFTFVTLRRWGTRYSSQDIAVVVSELVTNAVRHALPRTGGNGPPVRVRLGLLQYRPWLLCAVADPSKATPVPRASGFLAETGRGLQMVCALSDQWGYTKPTDAGKIVWAMFTER
jgi:anti-sigma regulatory factor (Ser/Thr protein kinase)